MARKKELKTRISKKQKNKCALSGEILPDNISLMDTDRIIPKAENGEYTDENTRCVTPSAHMERHGNIREREKIFEELKAILDDREQVRKVYQKVNNQLLAGKRKTDKLSDATIIFLESESDKLSELLKSRDKILVSCVKNLAKYHPLAERALKVRGVGPVTVAYCLVYIDLEKARHASCLWAYAGLHKASHERYEKGKKSGGNKSLRTALWTMTESQIKKNGAYRTVYDRTKEKLAVSEKMVKTCITKKVWEIKPWKDVKACHRDGAGRRAIMKHFLADYWMVGRKIMGLPTDALYAEAILGKTHLTIQPEERGW